MAAKSSRYRLVPDVTVPDAKGRTVRAKEARELPDVTGTYAHTVVAGDRLDRLAWTYYGDPLKFWRICDANPEFLSPLALIGQEPLITARIPVTLIGDEAPRWTEVTAKLRARIGVESVIVVDDVVLTPVLQDIGDERVTVTVEVPDRALVVTYNRVNVAERELADLIETVGFKTGPPGDLGAVGRQIIIPVAVTG